MIDHYKFAWLLWIGGTILIVLSWDGTVSPEVGWTGYAIALVGVGVSYFSRIQAKLKKPDHSPTTRGIPASTNMATGGETDRPSDERFVER